MMVDVLKNPEDPTIEGGCDLTIAFTAEQVATLGSDAPMMLDQLNTALWALAAARSGEFGQGYQFNTGSLVGDWQTTVADVSELIGHLTAIRDVAVLEHQLAGGTYGELGRAMGVARSTAQSRREALLASDDTEATTWVREGPIEGRGKGF